MFVFTPFRPLAWRFVKRWVRQQFPDVPSLSTDKLASWLASELSPPILIDARKTAEFQVSHLPGAQHLPTVEAIKQTEIPADATLVIYCSIGYRSARLAKQLQAAGYPHVMNLEGSIFEWFNQGHPVVAEGEPTTHVHPYNRTWGLLLKSSA